MGTEIRSVGKVFLRLKNIMLASLVESHIIEVRNRKNYNDRVAKP